MPAADSHRPGEVSAAGWFAGGAGLLLLIRCLEQAPGIGGADTRWWLSDMASGWPSLHLNGPTAVRIFHSVLLVEAIASVAMLVLSVYVLRRDRAARIALTALVVPVVIGGFFAGQMEAAFVAVAGVLLWTPPANDWFAGRARRVAEDTTSERTPIHPSARGERPASYGVPVPSPTATDPAHRAETTPLLDRASLDALPPPEPTPAQTRPQPVSTACGAAIIGSGLMALLSVTVLVGTFVVPREVFLREITRLRPGEQDPAHLVDQVITMTAVIAVVALLWSLGALTLAWLALRGNRAACVTLMVSSGLCAAVTFLAGLSVPPLWLATMASLVTLGLLSSSRSVAWFRPAGPRPPAGPGPR